MQPSKTVRDAIRMVDYAEVSASATLHDVPMEEFIAEQFSFYFDSLGQPGKFFMVGTHFKVEGSWSNTVTLILSLKNAKANKEKIDGSPISEMFTLSDMMAPTVAHTEDGRYWWLYEEPEANYTEWQPLETGKK